MDKEYKFGLNVLNDFLSYIFNDLRCEILDCMVYNANLDFALRTLNKYKTLRKIRIYANSSNFTYQKGNQKTIQDAINDGIIEIYHVSQDDAIIHAKLYRGWRSDETIIGALGSPNFTNHSNQNIETLLILHDRELVDSIWSEIPNIYYKLGLSERSNIPVSILEQFDMTPTVDPKYLEGLWAHQKAIFEWMVKRNNSIINIPPGCGKTKIATAFIQYIFDTESNPTILVLVPTRTLIDQWLNRLSMEGIQGFELGTDLSNLGRYFANPSGKALVTLYSRFYDLYPQYCSKMRIVKPSVLIIADECHNLYEHLREFEDCNKKLRQAKIKAFNLGLSATIESFKRDKVARYIELMGGENNRYSISLTAFYAHWNDLNPTPSLKEIIYIPIKYRLSEEEMKRYKKYSQLVGIQSGFVSPTDDEQEFSAAIKRASWVRSLRGGVNALIDYLDSHIETVNRSNMIIFVQTNEIAEEIRDYITSHPGWDDSSSAYIYDSTRNDKYREYALEQFRKNKGFCLISERMLSEGFDIPKISGVILHGSHRSERDWIQKIGRAIRFDKEQPEAIANIIDIVFCDPNGEPLPIESERYETLKSISI
ncbi:MAG: DEAD/DEAH box helicase family protein [Candidatus Hodarchaeales archaeon]